MWKTFINFIINNVDNVDNIEYNRGITNLKERNAMRLADEIEKINNQSKQIADIRQSIIKDMEEMEG